jgi:membrane peptidoglycan carboxypeptidase
MSAQNPPRGPLFSAVLGFIAFSAVAGLLVVAMMTPGIAITSVTAKSAIGIFNNLPTYISIGTLPGPNTIYAQDGTNPDGSVKEVPVATIFDENRQQVAWNKISAAAKNAAVDGEDRRFYSHGGVDVTGIIRAALAGLGASSGGQQGASTIAQQLVKNLFIQEALQAPTLKKQTQGIKDAEALTLDRKLKEAKLAISLEKKYTKKQILLAYLNIAPFGGTTYGIEAAAQRYYGISASQLNNVQAATLMAIVQNPNQKAPTGTAGYASNTSRRDDILGRSTTPVSRSRRAPRPSRTFRRSRDAQRRSQTRASGAPTSASCTRPCRLSEPRLPSARRTGSSAVTRSTRRSISPFKTMRS